MYAYSDIFTNFNESKSVSLFEKSEGLMLRSGKIEVDFWEWTVGEALSPGGHFQKENIRESKGLVK